MSKRSIHSSSEGFSLVELLVGLIVALAVTAAVLALAVSSRSLLDSDRARTDLNQNRRASREILTADLLRAGERLGSDFPAIEIIDGGAGVPDQLVLRRNLLDDVLPVCEDVNGTITSFKIAVPVSPPTGCIPAPDSDADGWPDNLQNWRAHRLLGGGAVLAYMFNPSTGDGEFFEYELEDQVLLELVADSATVWANNYPLADQPRIYILEERRYELDSGLLRVVINQDPTDPLHLIDEMEDFQAVAVLQDGSEQDSFGPADVWSDLGSIEVDFHARTAVRQRYVDQTWSLEVMPRNVISN